jgi:hypothetical protein
MTAASGPYFLAWVAETETTFGPEHHVEDEEIVRFRIAQVEGDFATMSLDVRNPRIGLLNPGRKVWAWFSWDSGGTGGVVPLFFGRLVGSPSNMFAEVVTLEFVAKPLDFNAQKAALAESLKVRPYYDPIFIDEQKRSDPDTVLEGYSALWHIGRTDLVVSISDVLQGEDGVLVFTADEVPYASVQQSFGKPPLTSVQVTGDINWAQAATGTIDFGTRSFDTWTGGSIVSSWPKTGAQLSGGWSVRHGFAIDVLNVGGQSATSHNLSYENRDKKHEVGDMMSMHQSWTTFPVGGFVFTSGLQRQAGVVPAQQVISYDSAGQSFNPYAAIDNPDGSEKAAIPLHVEYHQTLVAGWLVNTGLVLDYNANNKREETVLFTIAADLQPIVTLPDPADVVEQIPLNGADVGIPIDGVAPQTDTSRYVYFETDRGRWSLEYMISVACAHIRYRARAVNLSWAVPFERAVELSCRKNATLYDDRIGGGTATGKIISYELTGDGSAGLQIGNVTIGCAIGRDGTVAAVAGTPTWVEIGWVNDGWQVMDGATTTLGAGTVAYELPAVTPGGLIYPLTKDQVVVHERIDITLTEPVQVGEDPPGRREPFIYTDVTKYFQQFPSQSYYLELLPTTDNVFNTPYTANVSLLKIPKQIDLEAAPI